MSLPISAGGPPTKTEPQQLGYLEGKKIYALSFSPLPLLLPFFATSSSYVSPFAVLAAVVFRGVSIQQVPQNRRRSESCNNSPLFLKYRSISPSTLILRRRSLVDLSRVIFVDQYLLKGGNFGRRRGRKIDSY